MDNQQADSASENTNENVNESDGIRMIDNGGRTDEDMARVAPSLPDVRRGPRCSAYDDAYGPQNNSGNESPGGQTPADGTTGAGDADDTAAPDQTAGGAAGSGRLIFQVTTAQGAIPLEGAQVTIYEYVPDSIPNLYGDTIMVMFSGPDGKTQPLSLPAPVRAYSLEAPSRSEPLPYALYNATVELDGYYEQNFSMIPVFDGITSIQRLDLIPLPTSARPDQAQQPGPVIVEGINPGLR